MNSNIFRRHNKNRTQLRVRLCVYSIQRKFMKSGTSFSQSASQ